MVKDNTISALIALVILDVLAYLISIFFLVKGKFRIYKLRDYLRETFTSCCNPLVRIYYNSRYGH